MTETARPAGRQAAFGFIYATAVMNALSFGLMIPVLPGLIRAFFGGTDTATTAAAADWQFIFTLTWGFMQFISGPVLGMISDRYGRRPVILVALALYGVGSLICATTQSIETLTAVRFVQALGGAGSIVLARAVVRDLYSGVRAGVAAGG